MTQNKPWQYCSGLRCSIHSPDREERARWMRELAAFVAIIAVLLVLITIFGAMATINFQNMGR